MNFLKRFHDAHPRLFWVLWFVALFTIAYLLTFLPG